MPLTQDARRLYRKMTSPQPDSESREEILQALHAHAGLMISSAARVTGRIPDAEDVAQDVAEKLLQSPPSEVRSWPALLKTMAVNAAIDRIRKRRDWTDLPPPEGLPEPEQTLTGEQRAEALRAAVSRLPERDATLCSLAYFAELSHGDIATQLDMSVNNVGVALHRIRKRLADDLRDALGMDTFAPHNSGETA